MEKRGLRELRALREPMRKKGLSPVIATVLLISMAIVLAAIIFIWARSFLGEKITKFGQPIENTCGEVTFIAESDGTNIYILNKGNVPISGVEIRKKSLGSVLSVKTFGSTISSEETESLEISNLDVNSGEEVVLVPTLLGESGSKKGKYVCDDSYGVSVTI